MKAIIIGLAVLSVLLIACTQQEPPPFPSGDTSGTGDNASGTPDTTPEEKVIVRQPGGMGQLIGECQDQTYKTENADYVIEGTVQNVRSGWNPEKTQIFTTTTLAVEKYVKGPPFSQNTIEIITPGGTGEDGITQSVEDQPIFHEGKKVRIFMEAYSGGEFQIVCAGMGVEEI